MLKSHNSPRKAIGLPALPDTRLEQLEHWLAARLGPGFALAPASTDASFRRYFRVTLTGASWIAMDAPPEREDCRAFVRVARLLRAAGLNAPEVIACDLRLGFALLTDLGRTTYLEALDAHNADALFADAIEALVRWQAATRPGALPDYSEALLRAESGLFPEWYVGRHLGLEFDRAQRETWGAMLDLIVRRALAQPRVYVHRDFMPRNLMVADPNPGVLDFQDAVCGPASYDIVSLTRDAFVSWEEERVRGWAARYFERARRAGVPLAPDFAAFYRDFEWMGLQRHLKVLGIFARLRYRDGKSGYLEDTPRFWGYVRAVTARYAELAPLARLLDRLEERVAARSPA